jgi:tetratricopeptide (TPR) repeat protein
MMTDRIAFFAFLLLGAVSLPAAAARQGQPAPEAGEPREATDEPQTPSEPTVSAEEAIRLAIETLDRLEAHKESDKAEKLLEEANGYVGIVRDLEPGNPWLSYLQGRVLALAGRHGDAIEQLRKFVSGPEGRNEWRAYRTLGDVFVGEFPQLAKANYKKANALIPDEPSVLFGLSVCAAKLGGTDEAIRMAREAVAADGKRTVRYVSHLSRLLQAAARWDEALREAKVALDLSKQQVQEDPGRRAPLLVVDAQYQLLIGLIQSSLARSSPKRDETAESDTARLGSDYLRLAKYLRERSKITQMLARHDVLHALETGVDRTAPDTLPALLAQYGIALAEAGRTADAVEVFQRLLSADQNNAVAAEWLARLQPTPAAPHEPD